MAVPLHGRAVYDSLVSYILSKNVGAQQRYWASRGVPTEDLKFSVGVAHVLGHVVPFAQCVKRALARARTLRGCVTPERFVCAPELGQDEVDRLAAEEGVVAVAGAVDGVDVDGVGSG